MRDDERKRLIDLELKAESGSDLQQEIHNQLYDSERSYTISVELEVSDPMMELSDVEGKCDMVATEILAELSPEWFSRYHGASWWVTKYRGYRTGYARRGGWRTTEEPFPTPDPHKSMDPHQGHEIRGLCESRIWHDLMPDGTLGEARESGGSDVIRRFCVTCDADLTLP